MSENIVLDASALIALIYEEKGSKLVEESLPHAAISTVNLTEVASYMVKNGIPIAETTELLKDLSLKVVDFDETQAFIAASFIHKTSPKGLSLADRACLALAKQRDLPALTADLVWLELDLKIKIKLIR